MGTRSEVGTSPWRLTDNEAAFMDAFCELGTVKAAALALGVSYACGQTRLRNVKFKMSSRPRSSGPKRLIPTVRAALLWDRWSKTA